MIQGSTVAAHVDHLFLTILVICGTVFVLIAAVTIYLGIKYRAGAKVDRSKPPASNLMLEIGWTLPTLVIFICFFIWGANLYSTSRATSASDMEVFVIAKQWMWKFQHADGKKEINELHVPVGKKIKLSMISEDVVHSLFVPDFRIKQDILPQRYTTLVFEATAPGVYPLLCTQYCGLNHAKMLANVIVMNAADFAAWSKIPGTRMEVTKVMAIDPLVKGKKLFNTYACSACHLDHEKKSDDEVMSGPNLWNVYGSKVTLKNGSTVIADDNYIHESVYRPNAKIVKGFEAVMPTFEGQINAEDFQAVLTYIKSLKAK